MATQYRIDINNVRPNGNKLTSGVFIGNGTSNRESLYGVRGTGGANVVIYDKVLYELEMNDVSNVEGTGVTLYATAYTKTNKRTHGDNTVDTNIKLGVISGGTVYDDKIDIPANTAGGIKTYNLAVIQYDDAAEFSCYSGASVPWTITQKSAAPTGITITLNTPTVIPASGGTVGTTTFVAKAQMADGSEVDISSDTGLVLTWTSVTAVSKGTTESTETTAGTLSVSASYACGTTFTAIDSIEVKQEKNEITATTWTNPVLTAATFATPVDSAGGSVTRTADANATQTGTSTYTSTATASTANTTFTWNIESDETWAQITNGTSKTPSLNVDAYTVTTASRSATIKTTVTGTDSKTATGSCTVEQTQATAYYVKVTNYPASDFTSAGTTSYKLKVSANTQWYLVESADWYSYDVTAGTGEVEVTLTVNAATDRTIRSADTSVSADTTVTKTPNMWTVKQDAMAYIDVGSTTWGPSFASATTDITITTNCTSWGASSDSPSWLSATTGTGKVTLEVGENSATTTRSGVITITANGATNKTISVTQGAHGAYYITVTPSSLSNVSSAGTATTITVSTNLPDWVVARTSGPTGWSCSKDSTTSATITITANSDTATTTGVFTFSGDGVTTAFNVSQDAKAYLLISETTWNPSDAAETKVISVSANTTWGVSSDSIAWLTVTGNTAASSATMEVQSNSLTTSRSGIITFTGTNVVSQTIDVTQAAHAAYYVVVTGTGSTSTSAGTIQNLSISANTSWTLSSNQSWASLSKTGGTGDDTATLTIAASTSTADTTATITVGAGAGTATPTSWTVTRKGNAYITVSPTSWAPSSAVSNTSVTITTNLTSYACYPSISTWTGTTGGSLSIPANTSTAATTGSFVFSGGGVSATVSVTQDAKAYINLGETTWSPTYSGQTTSITVTTNVSPWNAYTSDSSWCTVSTATGKVNITVTENTDTANTRTATITVSGGSISETITVTQKKKTNLFAFITNWPSGTSTSDTFRSASTSYTVTVSANTSWEISPSSSWVYFSQYTGATTTGTNITMTIASNTGTTKHSSTVSVKANGSVYEAKTYHQLAQPVVSDFGAWMDVVANPYFSIKTYSATTSAASTFTVDVVDASGLEWCVNNGGFTTLSNTTGNTSLTETITINENKTTSTRVDTLKLTDASRSVVYDTLSIFQAEGEEEKYIIPTPDSVSFPGVIFGTSSTTISVSANTTYNISLSGVSLFKSWLTTDVSTGGTGVTTVTITASGNCASGRTAYVILNSGTTSAFTTVVQGDSMPSISISPKTKSVSESSTSITISISANTAWTVSTTDAWITIGTTTGTGTGSTTISIASNTGIMRTGSIVVAGGGMSKSCDITQESPDKRVYLTNNTDYTANVSLTSSGSSLILPFEAASGETDSVSYTANTTSTLTGGTVSLYNVPLYSGPSSLSMDGWTFSFTSSAQTSSTCTCVYDKSSGSVIKIAQGSTLTLTD